MNGIKMAKSDAFTVLSWKIQFFWDMMVCCWGVQCVVCEISKNHSAYIVRVTQSKNRTYRIHWLCR